MAKSDTAFLQDGVSVPIGNFTVQIKECPLARVKRFQQLWGVFFEKINRFQAEQAEAAETDAPISNAELWDKTFDLVLESPFELLQVLVPDLPHEPFEDEDNGVTIPQIFAAFDVILEVNRIGWIKKLTPFFQNMIQNINPAELLSDSPRTES